MSPVNKYEAAGIFLSIAVMAVALGFLRFQNSDTVLSSEPEEQQAAVVVAGEETNGLSDALYGAATPSGSLESLVVDDVRIGTGPVVKNGDSVTVHYIGTTQDGVQFDSSYLRGEPFTFTVGAGRVIKGWEEGLPGMQVGGQRILVIPASMAYGNRQVGPIPAGSNLVFAVELLEIK